MIQFSALGGGGCHVKDMTYVQISKFLKNGVNYNYRLMN